MTKLSLDVSVDSRNVEQKQPLMKYKKQYDLFLEGTALPVYPHPSIEVCPSCGALLTQSVCLQGEAMKMKEDIPITYPTSALQLSLNLEI